MDDEIRKMADLLRAGATMLKETCPTCNSPLFKVEGKTFCVKCGTTVAESPSAPPQPGNVKRITSEITSVVLLKLKELQVEISKTTDAQQLSHSASLMLTLLRILKLLEALGKD